MYFISVFSSYANFMKLLFRKTDKMQQQSFPLEVVKMINLSDFYFIKISQFLPKLICHVA